MATKSVQAFVKEATSILNNAEWFDARPVSESELTHFIEMLMRDCDNEIATGKDFAICGTRGIAVWAIKSHAFTENYYKFLVTVGVKDPTELIVS